MVHTSITSSSISFVLVYKCTSDDCLLKFEIAIRPFLPQPSLLRTCDGGGGYDDGDDDYQK